MDRRLRVLSVAHTAVSRSAGRLRYQWLADDPTLDIHLVVPERWHEFGRTIAAEPGPDAGTALHKLPIRLGSAGPASWYLHYYPTLGRLAAQLRPDVIHFWEEPWSVVALQGAALARRLNAALVLEVDQNIHKRLPPPFDMIRRHTLAQADLILARSPDAADVVRRHGYRGPTLPIGYGVDQSIFMPTDPAGLEPRRAGPLHLGYVGRIVEEKGLDDVLDAMARTSIDCRLTLLGEGPHRAALQARAAQAGLGSRVAFLPWTDPGGVAAFMRSCHVLLLPTRLTPSVKEQFGRVIIEAQACGRPVIGTRTGAIPSVMGDGGWVVPERDPVALADLLTRLAENPAEIAACGLLGLDNVARRFTLSAVARELAAGWRCAADRHRSRGEPILARNASRTPIRGFLRH